jgi:hypothetical protein
MAKQMIEAKFLTTRVIGREYYIAASRATAAALACRHQGRRLLADPDRRMAGLSRTQQSDQ